MQLVSVSTNIQPSQEKVTESQSYLHGKLNSIEHQMTQFSESQERGAEELASFFAAYNRAPSPESPHFEPNQYADDYGISSRWEKNMGQVEELISTKFPNEPMMHQSNTKGLNVSSGGTKSPSIYHFTFEQSTMVCDNSCLCSCHSANFNFQARLGTAKLFKHIFGSLLVGYSNSLTPKVACDTKICSRAPQGYKISIRYSFPAWFMNRVIFSLFSSHSNHHPNFALRITRRVPYKPGNIFSKINSRDFGGAIELLQSGDADINDIQASHGISVLGAALRSPVPGPGLIRFIEYLLRRQVNPYLDNDEGESAWHFAARLIFPNTPTSIAPAELQLQLRRLFPNPDWEAFQFSHVHKVVVGLRPVDLAKELENPKYALQVNAKDALGQTALGLAATLGDSKAIEALLLAGADPNTHTNSMTTFHPLRKAVRARSARCVELLLMASANPFSLDSRGASFLHTAAASCDDIDIIRPLLLAGIPLDGRNVHDCTPLSFTPLKDNVNVARFMLAQGADINNVDKDGDTPLTESVRLNSHGCLELFLGNSADYHTVNKRGRTILHFAAAHADVNTLDILASHHLFGLDTEAHDARGKTPMECLLERQYVSPLTISAFKTLLKSIPEGNFPSKLKERVRVNLDMQEANIGRIAAKSDRVFNWRLLLRSKGRILLDDRSWHKALVLITIACICLIFFTLFRFCFVV
jgi:ankyrin repeat protein